MTTKLAKWASEHDQIIKSKLSYGHQANPLHQKRGWPTIGSDLMVIWEMSDKKSGGDASFEEELSAFAIFEDVGANITFENANII